MGVVLSPFREVPELHPGSRTIRRGRRLRESRAPPAHPIEQDLDLVPVGEVLMSLGGWKDVG